MQEVRFRYSPGRRDPRYLGNRTAADAFVVHTTPSGGRGFVAIETKYVENLAGPGLWDQARYGKLATKTNAWLNVPPTDERRSQVALDHLLALSMLVANDGWGAVGSFSSIRPATGHAPRPLQTYAASLSPTGSGTFTGLTLEQVYTAIESSCRRPWVAEFHIDIDLAPSWRAEVLR